MQASQGLGPALIVTRQAAEASGPGETALNDPTSGQEHKAFLGFGQLDDDQFNAICGRGLGRLCTGVTLVDESNCDGVPSDELHLAGQFSDLSPLLFVGGGHMQGEQVAQRIHGYMHFATLLVFSAIIASAGATLWR